MSHWAHDVLSQEEPGSLRNPLGILDSLWWIGSLTALTALSAIAVVSAFAARRTIRLIKLLRLRSPSFENPLSASKLPVNALAIGGRDLKSFRLYRAYRIWNSLATRTYIVLVMGTVASGFISLVWPAPSWFRIVLLLFPFLGAGIVYQAWSVE